MKILVPKIVVAQNEPKLNYNDHFVIYDKKLLEDKIFKNWVSRFRFKYAVEAGEKLKNLDLFSDHIHNILRIAEGGSRINSFVAVGGGSVGDFTGFIASVYKRGTGLIQLPTTWLSLVDSAHGGKTGLNCGAYKNQIGTFKFASAVYVVKRILQQAPEKLFYEGLAEVAKTALFDSSVFKILNSAKIITPNYILKNSDAIIRAKYKVVKRDPYESKNIRQILNLGHTVGHVLETQYKLSHGQAVTDGLFFTLNWSLRKGYISANQHRKIDDFLNEKLQLKRSEIKRPLSENNFLRVLKQDKKKITDKSLLFIFMTERQSVVVEKVTFKSVLIEAKKQGLVR
ncbi:MAG: 3-dehydroquinate synthase [Bdellovibrionales bacterium]|nr:3-dehydroquinate synthase [Bdellovibrionales bacterium]